MSLVRKTYKIANATFAIWIYTHDDGTIWFKGKEVAIALRYTKPTDSLEKHVLDCDKIKWSQLARRNVNTPSGWQNTTTFINESGLYSLILRSKKPHAAAFRHWVTAEVLPQLRVSGLMNLEDLAEREKHVDVKPAHVYIATSDAYRAMGVYKLGHTGDLVSRLNCLNESRIESDAMYYVDTFAIDDGRLAPSVDAQIQEELRGVRDSREFYTLDESALSAFPERVERALGRATVREGASVAALLSAAFGKSDGVRKKNKL